MKLTNKYHLPDQVIHWLECFNEHNENQRRASFAELKTLYGETDLSISATSLLKPVKEVVLTDRHYNELERDAVELYDALIGSAIHESFRIMPFQDGEMREVRVGTIIKDVLVTGQFDYIKNNKIGDYKTMKIGSYLFGDKEFEYTAQLSVNRFLFAADNRYGKILDETGEIVMLFVDWRDREFTMKKYGFSDAPGYPHRGKTLELKLWDFKKTENFLLRKITDFKIASIQRDEELPECTDEERWMRATKKKVTYAKCEKYCAVKDWCLQQRGE